MSDVSIITLVKDRALHLDRLLDGICRSQQMPREVIIVDMSDVPVRSPPDQPRVRIVPMPTPGLSLAAARNRGAAAALGRHLLFLDVDCIPRSDLVAAIDHALICNDHLVCADVRYLGPDASDFESDGALIAASIPHPHRSFPIQGWRLENNPGLFWSLLFAVRSETFMRLGGFDERYEGYGAEDTDFGFRAQAANLPLAFLGGTGAFHQYHGVIDPPLQHLSDIVRNANRFFDRWRVWPMEGWLAAFAARDLVKWNSDALSLLRTPTSDELAAARQPPSVYF